MSGMGYLSRLVLVVVEMAVHGLQQMDLMLGLWNQIEQQ